MRDKTAGAVHFLENAKVGKTVYLASKAAFSSTAFSVKAKLVSIEPRPKTPKEKWYAVIEIDDETGGTRMLEVQIGDLYVI